MKNIGRKEENEDKRKKYVHDKREERRKEKMYY